MRLNWSKILDPPVLTASAQGAGGGYNWGRPLPDLFCAAIVSFIGGLADGHSCLSPVMVNPLCSASQKFRK